MFSHSVGTERRGCCRNTVTIVYNTVEIYNTLKMKPYLLNVLLIRFVTFLQRWAIR
jgi:hypothetical protein